MGLVECCNVSVMFLLVYLYDCPMNSEPNTQNKNKNLSWDGNSWIGREGLSTPTPLISCIHGNRMGGILLGLLLLGVGFFTLEGRVISQIIMRLLIGKNTPIKLLC